MTAIRAHNMFVAGLYSPPADTPIWFWNRHEARWQESNCGQNLYSRQTIWHPFCPRAPPRPNQDLREAARAVREGKIGPALPPYEFPYFKPTEMAVGEHGYVWFWRSESTDWRNSEVNALQDGQFWWPASDWGIELYGKPKGCP